MNNVEESESMLLQLLCYVDAIFIDWDDAESRLNIEKAFQLATFGASLMPFEKHNPHTQN
ncbi:MAG: hypothetical protein V4658_04565 [Bacteroidota bacterium]